MRARTRRCTRVVALLAMSLAGVAPADESGPNGFVLDGLRVPRAEIVAGGPARDAIRSVDAPRFAAAREASWVRADTPVIGVVHGKLARAYPVHVMEWHQVVNDRFGDDAVVISYDPLTDLAGAWRVPASFAAGSFGVSGLLDREGFLLYDRATSSLWSSTRGEAISGARAGARLEPLRARVETAARWLARHPDTTVLELPDRARVDYRASPYSEYWISETFPLAVRARDDRFHPKEVVLGVGEGDDSRVYVASLVTRAGGRVVDEIGPHRLRIAYDGESGTFTYEAPDALRVRTAYWFAWKNLSPNGAIWGSELIDDAPRPERAPGDAAPTR